MRREAEAEVTDKARRLVRERERGRRRPCVLEFFPIRRIHLIGIAAVSLSQVSEKESKEPIYFLSFPSFCERKLQAVLSETRFELAIAPLES